AELPQIAELAVSVFPLHGEMPLDEQARAVRPAGRRKIVLSTNVAESSVTIEGVVAVVDAGLARVAAHSPWTGLPTLALGKVSRAAAEQRAGRAGRTRPGRALRLYTQHDFEQRPAFDLPEIARADLTDTAMTLAALGIPDADALAWLEPPPAASWGAARELLGRLGALDAGGALTDVGRRMLRFPVHPRLGRLVVEGETRGAGVVRRRWRSARRPRRRPRRSRRSLPRGGRRTLPPRPAAPAGARRAGRRGGGARAAPARGRPRRAPPGRRADPRGDRARPGGAGGLSRSGGAAARAGRQDRAAGGRRQRRAGARADRRLAGGDRRRRGPPGRRARPRPGGAPQFAHRARVAARSLRRSDRRDRSTRLRSAHRAGRADDRPHLRRAGAG